jgi:hypothetical protein
VKKNELGKQVDRDGYGIVSTVVDRLVVRDLIEWLNGSDLPRSRAGVRHLMKDPWVAQLATRAEMIGIAREIVGSKAWPFRATLSTSHLHRIGWLHGIKTGHFLCGSGGSKRGGDPGR